MQFSESEKLERKARQVESVEKLKKLQDKIESRIALAKSYVMLGLGPDE